MSVLGYIDVADAVIGVFGYSENIVLPVGLEPSVNNTLSKYSGIILADEVFALYLLFNNLCENIKINDINYLK